MSKIFPVFIFCLAMFTLITGFFPILILFGVLWVMLMAGMGFSHWCDKN